MNIFKEKDNSSFHLILLFGWLSFVGLLCSGLAAQEVSENTIPVFTSPNPALSDSGYTKLIWSYSSLEVIPEHIEFELQQSATPDFQNPVIRYKGQDTATYISGMPNGNYFFRIRAINHQSQKTSEWSKTLTLTVKHHSLYLAFTLMLIGAIVFVSTVTVIINGNLTIKSNS